MRSERLPTLPQGNLRCRIRRPAAARIKAVSLFLRLYVFPVHSLCTGFFYRRCRRKI
uniref:Uncharacterized protein n=1 Tax=Myoviridae sp. ctzS633 TaxID=2825212 RepID=A0A8S5PVA0_9CAUD|nr:MAG TPA: hypothetical protein [Myoviridae sp. ctzS633]